MSCDQKTSLRNNQPLNPCSSEMLEYPWIPSTSTPFHGSESIVNFESTAEDKLPFQKEETGDEDRDGCHQPAGKKRRLSTNQVRFLERSFDVENKLEPERKVQLAKELGLQPRQVAIWFQNRRARYKTKNLEKEFDSLRSKYDSLNSDYDKLRKERERLKQEVVALKEKLIARGKVKKTPESTETMRPSHMEKEYLTTKEIPENLSNSSGANSDVFNSESPHGPEQNHPGSASSEQDNSSHAGKPDYSDFSQDEDDTLGESYLPPLLYLPKLEYEYYDEPPLSSCNFGFTTDDHPFWHLPY